MELTSEQQRRQIFEGIMRLPFNVADQTFDQHPGDTEYLHRIHVATHNLVEQKQKFISDMLLTSADEMEAAIFLLLCGYYRQSIGCLRSILELVTIGSKCYLLQEDKKFSDWKESIIEEIKFGESCQALHNFQTIEPKENELKRQVKVNLFESPNSREDYPGGLARQLYKKLSKYQHSAPGHTNADLWKSNGPVFDERAHYVCKRFFLEICAMTFLIAKIAQPKLELTKEISELFNGKIITITHELWRAYQVYVIADTHN